MKCLTVTNVEEEMGWKKYKGNVTNVEEEIGRVKNNFVVTPLNVAGGIYMWRENKDSV